MSKELRAKLIKYGASFGVALLMIILYVAVRDFSEQTLIERYRTLCDAFTVPAILFIMTGALIAVSNLGALDALFYMCTQGLRMLIPGQGLGTESYYDYVQRMREKRVHGYAFLFISGSILLAAALIFMALFYLSR